MSEFDLIICGAGTALCVLANRLSADPATRVLLLKTGGHPKNQLVTALGAVAEHWDSLLDWAFRSVPQATLNGRRIGALRASALARPSEVVRLFRTGLRLG